MTTEHGWTPDVELDRRLSDWLDESAAPRTPKSLETAFIEGIAEQRQRPAWATTGRWISMETRARFGAIPRVALMLLTFALLAALTIGTYAVAGGLTQAGLPAPYGLAENGLIAYGHDDATWVVDPTAAEAVRLTDPAEIAGATSWNRQGTRFSYESAEVVDGPRTIMVRDADGSNPVALSEPLAAEPSPHAWSPSGEHLLWSARVEDGCDFGECRSHIYLAATDGSDTRIISDPVLNARQPVWAPDGSFIVYIGSTPGEAPGEQLYRMDPDGSNASQLGELWGDTTFTFWRIDVSPDGTQLVTQAPRVAENGARMGGEAIYLVDTETGERTVLADQWPTVYDAVFSPDGTSVLFSRNELSPYTFDPRPTIADLQTGELMPIDVDMWARAWSPDGLSLLGYGEDSRIAILDISGDTVTEQDLTLLPDTVEAYDLSWQRLAP